MEVRKRPRIGLWFESFKSIKRGHLPVEYILRFYFIFLIARDKN